MTTPIDPTIAQQLDVLSRDFAIGGELGRGGMAIVFRATERATGRPVALKLLRPDQLGDAEALPRLEREAQLVQRLVHPRIVQLYRFIPLPPLGACLVMQLATGGTLKQRLQRPGTFPITEVQRILRDLVEALAAAHALGVIHRDVKPDNVYFGDDGRALLGDFGIARATDSDTLTLTGTAIGTPHYMAPEQIDGERVGPAADIYSLGLVGYAMLTGRAPWAGESLYSVIYKQKHESLPPISEIRPDAPRELLTAIEWCLQKDPGDRPGNATMLASRLGHAAPAQPSHFDNQGRTKFDPADTGDPDATVPLKINRDKMPERHVPKSRAPLIALSVASVGALMLIGLFVNNAKSGRGSLGASGSVNVAATVAGQQLRTTRLAEILATSQAPLEKDVARSIAELWVNYQLMAQAGAKGDSLNDKPTMDDALWSNIENIRVKKFYDTYHQTWDTVNSAKSRQQNAAIADSVYLAFAEKQANVEIQSGSAIKAKAISRNPLGYAKDAAPLAKYKGGELTASEFADWIAAYPPQSQVRPQLMAAADTLVEKFIRQIVRNELMLRAADSAKVQADSTEVNNLYLNYKNAVTQTWTGLNVDPGKLADSAKKGGDKAKIAAGRIEQYLDKLVKNETQFVDVPYFVARALQHKFEYSVNDAGLDKAVEKAKMLRATADSLRAKNPPPVKPSR